MHTSRTLGLLLSFASFAAFTSACGGAAEGDAPATDESDVTSDTSGGDVALLQVWIGETAGLRYESGTALGDKVLSRDQCSGADCRAAAQSVYDSLVVGPFDYDFERSGRCETVEIRTVLRESALRAPTFRGIGLHLSTTAGPVFVDKATLDGRPAAGRVTLADGTPGVVHRFVARGMCFGLGGNGGSIAMRHYELKPFAAFEADGAEHRVWEHRAENLRLGRRPDGTFVPSVDRQAELLAK